MHSTHHVRLQVRRAEPALTVDSMAFPTSHASVALSNDLRAVFCAGGRLLSYAEVHELGLSSTELWDLAAEHTIQAQVQIRTHPLGGIEVAAASGSAVDWLAHPHSYWLLHHHLTRILGGVIVYFAPTQSTLLAAPWMPAQLPKIQAWAAQAYAAAGADALLKRAVMYQRGYPASLTKQFAAAH